MLQLWVELTFIIFGNIFIIIYCSSDSKPVCNNSPKSCDKKYPYRSINGSCNNIEHPEWGMSVTPYRRLLPNTYADGKYEWPVSSTKNELPIAREISNKLTPEGNNPDRRYTLGLMQFGQFVAHDISDQALAVNVANKPELKCCVDGRVGPDVSNARCANIYIPFDDPVFLKVGIRCMNFERTATTFNIGCTKKDEPAVPLTAVTSYLDLSIVYAGFEDEAEFIRDKKYGSLRVVRRHGQTWPFQAKNSTATCGLPRADDIPCYKGGDRRMNQNPQLTILHTAFVRQHNRLTYMLSNINKNWNRDKIYQEARRINIAMYQHIIYTEYLPRILGKTYTKAKKFRYPEAQECVNDYDKHVDPSAIVESASAALRGLHSQISGTLKLISEDREFIDRLRISSHMNNPMTLEVKSTPDYCDLNYDHLSRGLAYQNSERANKYFDPEVKQYLFRNKNKLGIDLRAIDIQRQRDHGVGTYVEARRFCNLSVPNSFDDLSYYMTVEDVEALKNVYETVEDIDLSSGGILEYPAPDSQLGPTFHCIVAEQFYVARVGDRFFYENCEVPFSNEQLTEIRKSTFACLLCGNSYCVEKIQEHAFDPVSQMNPIKKTCVELCKMDLSPWQENIKGNYERNDW